MFWKGKKEIISCIIKLLHIKTGDDFYVYYTQKLSKFVKREVYDETIDFKCLKCSYEEHDVNWERL